MKRYVKTVFYILLAAATTDAACQNGNSPSLSLKKYLPDCSVNLSAGPSFTGIKGSTFSANLHTKAGYTIGADMTCYFKTYGKIKAGVSAGINYTLYSSEYKLNNLSDTVFTTDADNDDVYRYENVTNWTEKQRAGFIGVPILIKGRYPVTPSIDIFVSTGVCLSFSVNSDYKSSAVYTASGYYPKYNVTLFDIDIDGSPYFYPTNKKLSDDNSLKLKGDLVIPVSAGVSYRLDRMISLTAGLNEFFGIKNISGYNGTEVPVVDDNRKFSSLLQKENKVKTRAFAIELGVSLNLWSK